MTAVTGSGRPGALLEGAIFDTLLEAQVSVERWRREYNTSRPHRALGYRPAAPEAIEPKAAMGVRWKLLLKPGEGQAGQAFEGARTGSDSVTVWRKYITIGPAWFPSFWR